jgi:uncharacterized OB-fold protein
MTRALPVATPVTQPYWDGLSRGELLLQRCATCARHVFYPRPACPHCGGGELAWVAASGRARLHSFVISHMPAPGFEADVPYVIAIVELDEGPRMMTNLLGVAPNPSDLRVEMPLVLKVVERDGQALPFFAPSGTSS